MMGTFVEAAALLLCCDRVCGGSKCMSVGVGNALCVIPRLQRGEDAWAERLPLVSLPNNRGNGNRAALELHKVRQLAFTM